MHIVKGNMNAEFYIESSQRRKNLEPKQTKVPSGQRGTKDRKKPLKQ